MIGSGYCGGLIMKDKNRKADLGFVNIVDLHDNLMTLHDIEYISKDLKTKLQYESEFEKNLYSNIILYLTHKTFNEKVARQLWRNILAHRNILIELLSRDPGIVVSCLDYMSNIESVLKEPKIIEKSKSDYILSSTLIDNLTNLYIRNVFAVVLDKEFALSIREELPLSVLLMDIDDFKKINDKYGHAEGDHVLRQIGNIVNLSIRTMDFAARYGGEEIVVLLPNTTIAHAVKIGELIRERVFNLDLKDFTVTISIGASEIDEAVNDGTELVVKADQALYYAKKHGKNRVVGYSDSTRF